MLLSIITINYNNKLGLEKTICSVKDQTCQKFEYVIIDGNSIDGSLEIIDTYKSNITYWKSETDNGVYDAMNKGIKQATGEYLLMLNSGDCLSNNLVIQTVYDLIQSKKYDIFYGNILWEENGIITNNIFPDHLSFNFFRTHSLGHQAAFIKKEIHNIVGLYDSSLKIVSDWKFFILAICKYNLTYLHININISICGRDGISCDPNNFVKIDDERNETFTKFFSSYVPDYVLADKRFLELNVLKNNLVNRIYMFSKRILNYNAS